MQRTLPFDFLDKVCFAATDAAQGTSNAPTWELVLDGHEALGVEVGKQGRMLKRPAEPQPGGVLARCDDAHRRRLMIP